MLTCSSSLMMRMMRKRSCTTSGASHNMGAEPQILLDGKIDESAAAIRDMRDAEPDDVLGRLAIDARPGKPDLARRADHAAERTQGRRFAGAVGAQDRRDAARAD